MVLQVNGLIYLLMNKYLYFVISFNYIIKKILLIIPLFHLIILIIILILLFVSVIVQL
jgi:hypothetical protein